MFEKQAILTKKTLIFSTNFPWFFVKNRCKIDAKSCRTIIRSKINKKTRLEPDFSAKSQFLTDFGNPSGSPERSKRDEHHWQKLLPGAIWCNFVALQALLSLLAPFRLPSGTILTQFWLHSACFQASFSYRSGTKETAYRQCSMTATHRLALKIAMPPV